MRVANAVMVAGWGVLLAACAETDFDIPRGSGGGIVVPGAAGAAGAAGATGTAGGGAGGSSAGGSSMGKAGTSQGGSSSAGMSAGGMGGEAGGSGGAGGDVGGAAGAGGDAGGAAGAGAGAGGAAGQAGSAGVGGQTGGAAGAAGQAGSAGAAGGGPIPPLTGTPEDKAAVLAHLEALCGDTLPADLYDAATAPAPFAATNRGDIVRCGYDRLITKAEIDDHYASNGYTTVGAETDVHKIAVAYWTERAPGVAILTSGALFIPAVRVADPAPLIVYGHGSVGIADKCAPSKEDPGGFQKDWRTGVYAYTSKGYPVLMPDYPGLGTPGAHAWLYSVDEGHSLLDATRAARKMAKSGFFANKNVIIGHSQGGHAVISAQTMAESYGSEGTVDRVLAFSPIWFSQASWGAATTSLAIALKLVSPTVLASAMMYDYGHLDAYEGPTKVLDPFLPTIASDAQTFLENACWLDLTDGTKWPASLAVALQDGHGGPDLFTEPYVKEVGTSCASANSCTTDLAKTWRERWIADRPELNDNVPLTIYTGGLDTAVSPGRQQCAIDRINAQMQKLTTCGYADADHASVILSAHDHTIRTLREVFLGEPAPSCASFTEALGTVKCSTPPANGLDATTP